MQMNQKRELLLASRVLIVTVRPAHIVVLFWYNTTHARCAEERRLMQCAMGITFCVILSVTHLLLSTLGECFCTTTMTQWREMHSTSMAVLRIVIRSIRVAMSVQDLPIIKMLLNRFQVLILTLQETPVELQSYDIHPNLEECFNQRD